MDLLEVGRESGEEAVVVLVKGDVDSSTADHLRDQLVAALDVATTHPRRLLVVDLQAVNFFGSAGLNAVLDCHEAGQAAGTAVRLVADHPQVLQPIRVTELDRIFEIYSTVSDALQR
ncbi:MULTISPECIES: STAS domain-containing protein [Mycobacterium]|uniref:Anti-sigma factor antagonist n=1 Tax=Mycobacterium gordonae TaxID=1778 RepID=A0A1X1VWV4_MYCGO|nr:MULTISPECIES: STAS domain-containing protein [Mycobacterium]MBX9978316.1 STAS domain-containing protein [Mycobacterium gordonae]MCQ4364177.1 STAS domain-containing protein [Mycobacterium gordonae]MCV7005021.1 STAS domain-containing protein [Mycobacterium gordonae]ODR16186.1 anti-anti-sigma factor [Mycobacterium gordonae]ORV73537.1 anti-anti-sigma factor [Mycobacterium gordonae]